MSYIFTLRRNATVVSQHLQLIRRDNTASIQLQSTTSLPSIHAVITAMGAQQFVPPATPRRVWVVAGASRGIGEQYVAQVRQVVQLSHWQSRLTPPVTTVFATVLSG